jgi:hypothetical protein
VRHHLMRALHHGKMLLVAHLASIGVSGEVVPSSFAGFTPSARAI